MNKEQLNDEITNLKRSNEKIEEMKIKIPNEFCKTMEDFNLKLHKINNIVNLEGYLSEKEIEFYDNYSAFIRKSQLDMEYEYESYKNISMKKINKNIIEIERLNLEIENMRESEEGNT